jgi:hypothetical protein
LLASSNRRADLDRSMNLGQGLLNAGASTPGAAPPPMSLLEPYKPQLYPLPNYRNPRGLLG